FLNWLINVNMLLFCVWVCGSPLRIFFIVMNEFCKRFSYYEMRTVLVVYFKYFLRWDEDLATSIYHTLVICVHCSVFQSSSLRTIIYLSVVYVIGQVAVDNITDSNRDGTPDNITFHVWVSVLQQLQITESQLYIYRAPLYCPWWVSSPLLWAPVWLPYGGDQFSETVTRQRRTFFSVFYLCINGGSLLSTIITPILRSRYIVQNMTFKSHKHVAMTVIKV
uniref:Uncharacterized protein n=1 Tax=Amphilophus citrinellus TaxID=61819 RepID=A0A3Q0SRJ8_AMPCI